MSNRATFRTDLRVGETLRLDGGRILVTLLEKSGQRARISIEADKSVPIQIPHQHDNKGEKILAGAV